MTDRISVEERLAELRRQAEMSGSKSGSGTSRTTSEQDSLVHDLQVHQIELEIQNEELYKTRELLSESLEKYADLYNFAPVGYITLGRDGLIVETNLIFSSLIDREKARLINAPLELYVAADDRRRFQARLTSSRFSPPMNGRVVNFVWKNPWPAAVYPITQHPGGAQWGTGLCCAGLQ